MLIAGGYDKGLPLGDLAREIVAASAEAILMGPVGLRLGELLEKAGWGGHVARAATMADAVAEALARSRPGGVASPPVEAHAPARRRNRIPARTETACRQAPCWCRRPTTPTA